MNCKLCGHDHTGRCMEDAPNAQFRCACPGECQHGKHPAYCRDCHSEWEALPQRLSADKVLEDLYQEWPNIRQLIEGWATTTPKDEWSEWDESVRQTTIRFSFLLEGLHAAREARKDPRESHKAACDYRNGGSKCTCSRG